MRARLVTMGHLLAGRRTVQIAAAGFTLQRVVRVEALQAPWLSRRGVEQLQLGRILGFGPFGFESQVGRIRPAFVLVLVRQPPAIAVLAEVPQLPRTWDLIGGGCVAAAAGPSRPGEQADHVGTATPAGFLAGEPGGTRGPE